MNGDRFTVYVLIAVLVIFLLMWAFKAESWVGL
jgi:hypothetical protein